MSPRYEPTNPKQPRKTGTVQTHAFQVERCPHCGREIVIKASAVAHVEAKA